MTDIVLQSGKFELEKFDTPRLAFLFYDGNAVNAAKIAQDARSAFAFSLHMVLENELWREDSDHNGEPFSTQNDYLKDLSQRTQVGVSTMKSYHTAIRLARFLGFPTMQEIDEIGLDVFKEVARRLVLDRGTAAPLRLKNGRLPANANITDYVRDAIAELGVSQDRPDTNLTPFDRSREMQRLFEPGSPRIWFEFQRGKILWFYEVYNDGALDFRQGEVEVKMTDNPPGSVFSELMNKLGVNID